MSLFAARPESAERLINSPRTLKPYLFDRQFAEMFPLLAAIRRWLAVLLLLSLQTPSDWTCPRTPSARQMCREHRRSRANFLPINGLFCSASYAALYKAAYLHLYLHFYLV